MKLYAGWFCPFAQRVSCLRKRRSNTNISKVFPHLPYFSQYPSYPMSNQYNLISQSVNPYHKPKSLLDLNPRGLVPTLQYHNKPLYESTVLCEFLEEATGTTRHGCSRPTRTRARTSASGPTSSPAASSRPSTASCSTGRRATALKDCRRRARSSLAT